MEYVSRPTVYRIKSPMDLSAWLSRAAFAMQMPAFWTDNQFVLKVIHMENITTYVNNTRIRD